MNVLIVDFDVLGSGGGGQKAYARLIEATPQRHYYYFSKGITTPVTMAPNATALPYADRYQDWHPGIAPGLAWLHSWYVASSQYAAAARDALGAFHFDVVDVPDYTLNGLFIRNALQAHAITVGTVALALHGTISHAFRGDWEPAAVSKSELRQLDDLEDLQFRLADVRYAISRPYAEHWRKATGLSSRYVDPLHITGPFDPSLCIGPERRPGDRPDLVLAGRREGRKGGDLFLDLAWAVDPAFYGRLLVFGAESPGVTGATSLPILEKAAALRRIEVQLLGPVPFERLKQAFQARSIVLIPSRIDSFNLVALEALRLGCPVFVSEQAGVAEWIRRNYPILSDLVIDLGCGREAAAKIRHASVHYDALCRRIADAVEATPLTADTSELDDMYTPIEPDSPALKGKFAQLAATFQAESQSQLRPRPAPEPLQISPTSPDPVASVAEAEEAGPLVPHVAAIANYGPALRSVRKPSLCDEDELALAIRLFSEAAGTHRSARVDLFDRLRQMELARADRLTATLYDLRAMRWLGSDRVGRMSDLREVLSSNGFQRDAGAAFAMYADPVLADGRCRSLIDETFRRCLTRREAPLEICDDRRGPTLPTVSLIVSMYNASSKLPTLLENVSIQSLAKEGRVEVVLVDSGSPGPEYQVFQEVASRFELPIVFARSPERETIQAAWNRGIGLARAPYLCFYGVDEGMHPDCLATLAAVLDAREDVDWVMADSLVTDVDQDGILARDVMEYRRDDLDREMVYLDTCYLSWVGGLYRRSIHERFGYYDESFRAAGDTEFKCRVLSRINILHVPRMLGVFNNYPEERTTAHPRAEIEDQRAWYLHRTSAGMANLFDGRSIENAERLLRRCLGYRKSYCNHISTDFDLASAIIAYMEGRGDNPDFVARSKPIVERAHGLLVSVDRQSLRTPVERRQAALRDVGTSMAALELQAQASLDLETRPQFRIFNDNRHEQHWWSWSTA